MTIDTNTIQPYSWPSLPSPKFSSFWASWTGLRFVHFYLGDNKLRQGSGFLGKIQPNKKLFLCYFSGTTRVEIQEIPTFTLLSHFLRITLKAINSPNWNPSHLKSTGKVTPPMHLPLFVRKIVPVAGNFRLHQLNRLALRQWGLGRSFGVAFLRKWRQRRQRKGLELRG